MNPPSLFRLTADDLVLDTEQKRDNLATLLNRFIEQSVSLFDGNLTVGDNVRGQVFTVSFTTPADYVSADNFTPILLTYMPAVPIESVLVGSLQQTDSPTTVLRSVTSLDWYQPALDTLRINFISGLDDSTRYQAFLLVL